MTPAIEASTAALAAANPEAFRYRGADLRHAVERAAFIALGEHDELQEAFAEGGTAEELSTRLETDVAARLLGRGSSAPRPWHPRSVAARLHHAAAGRRDSPPRPAGTRAGPVCFLLDHAKFVRFVEPVADAMRTPAHIVCTHPDRGADEQLPMPGSDAPRQGRALGRGLWQYASLAALFDALCTLLSRHAASAVVVVEGNSPFDEVAGRAAAALGLPRVALQQGWSPFVHTGFRNMSWDRMAVWGQGFADLLAAANPRTSMAVTGSPALAARREHRGTGVAFFLQSTSGVIGPEHLEVLYAAVEQVAAARPGVDVLVRPHPGAPLDEGTRRRLTAAPNVRWVPASDHTLQEVLDAAAVAVSIYSTSLLEAAASGVPCVILNPTTLPPLEPDLDALGAGRRVMTAEEATEAVAGFLDEGPPARTLDAFADRWFAGADGLGAERMATVIDDLVAVR